MNTLRVSLKKQAKIKMALQGCAGSGKTYSALLLAYGLTKDWSRIAVIDSENGSADLYANLGGYNVLPITDYSPETYIEAINVCENAGMEVIIIDSISHCWDFLLEYHAGLMGNSFVNWAKVTPRQNAFIQRILQSKCHVICTMRTKQDYVLNEKNGKMVPEKVGLKAVMRDGVDYEFTIVLDIDLKHHAVASKDRTGLFMGRPEAMSLSIVELRRAFSRICPFNLSSFADAWRYAFIDFATSLKRLSPTLAFIAFVSTAMSGKNERT